MAINDDIRKLNPGSLVDLYEIDLNPIGVPQIIYLCPHANTTGEDLLFQGVTYQSFPIQFSGFERKGSGSEARPRATISNYSGIFSQYLQSAGDLVGTRVTRKRTLTKYLNTGSPDESAYSKEVYYIEQKTSETATMIEFELSSALDLLDKRLPGRVAIANSCPWRYGPEAAALGDTGSGCGWPGTNASKWFDRNDVSVGSKSLDVCGKHLSSCKARFGQANPLDYGGYPSLGRT